MKCRMVPRPGFSSALRPWARAIAGSFYRALPSRPMDWLPLASLRRFLRSIALVNGPTEPWRGVTHPARSWTSSAMSETMAPELSLEIPTPTTAAPGRIMSARTRSITPVAEMTTSASAVIAARSGVRLCASVTVASIPCHGQQQSKRLADKRTAPDDHYPPSASGTS